MYGMSRTLSLVLALVVASVAFGKDEDAPRKNPKNERQDVEAIGEREIAKGPNFYSIRKEIALGKRLAQGRRASLEDRRRPVIAEYVNRLGQNPGAQLGRQGAVYDQADRQRRHQRVSRCRAGSSSSTAA